jgi:flagella basal body P-ring formation protein FlgA
MRFAVALLIGLFGQSVLADVVTPVRTIRPGSLIAAADLVIKGGDRPGVFDHILDVVGQEARTALYAGRPIPFDAVGPPALVDRNQIVSLRFEGNGLRISTEGRSLERGGIGDRVRIMNLSSRATLFGYIQEDGTIKVTQ